MDHIIKKIIKFRDERGWDETDTPENLTKSIVLEAAELLDNFQWGSQPKDIQNMKEELADILILSLALAHDMDFDVEEIIDEKLKVNTYKYPMKK